MKTLMELLFGVVTDGVDGLRLDKQVLRRGAWKRRGV